MENEMRKKAIMSYKDMTVDALDKIFRGRQMLLNKEEDDTELKKELDEFIAEKSKEIMEELEKMPSEALTLMALLEMVSIAGSPEEFKRMMEEEDE